MSFLPGVSHLRGNFCRVGLQHLPGAAGTAPQERKRCELAEPDHIA